MMIVIVVTMINIWYVYEIQNIPEQSHIEFARQKHTWIEILT